MGLALTQFKSALRSNLKNIALSGLEFGYNGGQARAEVSIDFGQKKFDLQGRIDGMDAARLYSGFNGRANVEVSGRGEFLKDPLEVSYSLSNRSGAFIVKGHARILTNFSDFHLNTTVKR